MRIISSKGEDVNLTDSRMCAALLDAASKLAKRPKSLRALMQFKHIQFLPEIGRMRKIRKEMGIKTQDKMYLSDPYICAQARRDVEDQLRKFSFLSASLDLLFFGPGSNKRKRKMTAAQLQSLIDEIAAFVPVHRNTL